MANHFDRWRKDAFFSAAEEVQESADIMESTYRIWERERRQGLANDDAVELERELHTALGTTKWQLQEFERTVKLCHQDNFVEDMVSRHKQFVQAIDFQVSRIEKALRDSASEEGKQPFRWVQLDEQDRDDLALFLSGSLKGLKGADVNSGILNKGGSRGNEYSVSISVGSDFVGKEHDSSAIGLRAFGVGYKESLDSCEAAMCTIDLTEKMICQAKDELEFSEERPNGPPRILSASDTNDYNIVINDEDANEKALEAHPTAVSRLFELLRSVEHRTKLSFCRSYFRKWKVDCQEEDVGIPRFTDLKATQRLSQKCVVAIIPNAASVLQSFLMPPVKVVESYTDQSEGISALNEKCRSYLHSCRGVVKTSHTKQFLGHADGLRRQWKSLQYHVHRHPPLKIGLMILLTFLFFAALVLCVA